SPTQTPPIFGTGGTLGTNISFAQSTPSPAPLGEFRFRRGTDVELPLVTKLTFFGGAGRVDIDLPTGNVSLNGLTPDEASCLFWEALTASYPSIKAEICAGGKQ